MAKAALKLCFDAHKDQTDKSGLPYVFHPFHLAEQMDSEKSVCVALLHDVMEDADFTVDDIRSAGRSMNVSSHSLGKSKRCDKRYLKYCLRNGKCADY